MSTQSQTSTNETIRLKREWFNPLYFHLRKYVEDPRIREILVYGGKSSAKTFSIAQLFILLGYMEGCNSIAYRKEAATVRTTIKNALSKAVESIYFDDAWQKMDLSFRCVNGCEIPLKGLDVEGKVKGIESYKYLLFDELDQFSEEEWLQANASLRGIPGQKLFATWNPVSITSWIKINQIDKKKWIEQPRTIDGTVYTTLSDTSSVHLSENGHTLLIKTSYHDNRWIAGGDGYGYRDVNLIDQYEDRRWDENWYKVNVLGEWGIPQPDKPWCYAFTDQHISDQIDLNPRETVYLSFDFNISPMTCTAHQYAGLEKYWTLYEFRSNNTGTEELCRMILGSEIGDCHFVVTGDATGRNRNAMSGNLNNYQIILQALGLGRGQIKVPMTNPGHGESRTLTNSIFARHKGRLIHPRCKYLIEDLRYIEAKGDGKEKDKPVAADKSMGHLLDGVRYMDNTFFPNFIKQSRRIL